MLIVHTGVKPSDARPIEEAILNVPGIVFEKRGPCRTPAEVLEAVREADAAICIGEPYTREVFAGAPRLRGVVRLGIGVDTIDLEAATEAGVMAANFPDFCIPEVANHAMTLLLACAKKLVAMDQALRQGGWAQARQLMSPMGTIHGQTLGLVAFGNIARATAQRAQAFDLQVIAHDPFVPAEVMRQAGVEPVSLEELAARSDYVSCHVPLTPKTRGMLSAVFFAAMKPSAYLINTSRGGLIEEPELIAALQSGQIAGAGLDVFVEEPLPAGHPFLSMANVALTPHTASYADATFDILYRRVALAALAIAQGGLPEHVANAEVLGHVRPGR